MLKKSITAEAKVKQLFISFKAFFKSNLISTVYNKVNITVKYILVNDNNIAFTVYYLREIKIKISGLTKLIINIKASGTDTSRVSINIIKDFS